MKISEVEREYIFLDLLVHRGQTAVDIGANHGLYTNRLYHIGCSVFAYEPIELLAADLKSRHWNHDQVHVFNMALSDRASHATLRIPRIDDQLSCGLASLNDHIKSSQEGYVEVTVQTSTLDQLDISDIAFVKIDVEGYEQEVLKGSVETIQKDHPIILIELEERYRKGTLQNSYDFLRCYRYKGYYYDKKEKLMKAYSVPMVLENQTGFYSGQQCDYMNNFIFIYGEDHTDIIEQINTRMKYVERYIDNSLEVKSDEEIALHRTEE